MLSGLMTTTLKLNENWPEVEALFEDTEMLVLNKPAGLLVVPDRWDKAKDNIVDLLRPKYTYIANVHRLDKETSGVLILAKTPESLSTLTGMFRSREVEKNYVALIRSALPESPMLVEEPIADDPRHPGLSMISKSGKPAETVFETQERFRHFSFIRAKPHTGRMHQIRVHLKAIGCPIVADQNYGNGLPLLLSHIKKKYKAKSEGEEKPLLNRLGLHAEVIRFIDPPTGKTVEWVAPLPKDMALALKYLRKYALA